MSEILQIFHQPPPSHRQMHTDAQRGLVNAESQSLESEFSSTGIFDVTDQFKCSEFDGSCFGSLLSSSVDELSKVTAVVEQSRSLKKRKLEFDVLEVESGKQSVVCDIEPEKAKEDSHNENSEPKTDTKRDYIHVRVRRGQATDNHSLAERARRERIKNKMQILQDLVPGCDKMTNKAAILDEIITYVQCLQNDVKILTMKLAASTTSET